MQSAYVLSHLAEQDVDEITTYIAANNRKAAHNFIDTLYNAFSQLAENPYLGHTREEITDYPVRFWPFKWQYLIVYRLKNPLEIVRVLHGSRDLVNLLD